MTGNRTGGRIPHQLAYKLIQHYLILKHEFLHELIPYEIHRIVS